MSKIVVVGGGAAGMMAALWAARNGHNVTLIEKNEKLGKKLYITGKGRCNLTNACQTEEFFDHVVSHPRFLYSAFYEFSNQAAMQFFEELGLPLKVERGGRVFPASDRASDVTAALSRELKKRKVEILLFQKVSGLWVEDGALCGVYLQKKHTAKTEGNQEAKKREEKLAADKVILATGGLSYPSTGSTGDGYRLAEEAGHKKPGLSPALVPLAVKEDWIGRLQGLSLKNIEVTFLQEKKKIYQDFGEMLFTHFGVSGPVILSASSYLPFRKEKGLRLLIDLKPALSEEKLDARLLREFSEAKNKALKNAMERLLPQKIIPVMIEQSQIPPEKKVNEITRQERARLLEQLKAFSLTITGPRDYKEAIVTQGGIDLREVNPSTMESKKLKNLYFAGELLDLDAVTGGFNLQIAWSTGYLAGCSV